MQVLYVTEFLVEGTDPETPIGDIVDDLLGVLGDWLGDPGTPVQPSELQNDGYRDLRPTHGSIRKSAEWNYLSAGKDWATRVRSDRPLHPRTSLSPG